MSFAQSAMNKISGGKSRIVHLLFASDRSSIVFRNIASSLLARGFSIISTFVMIPIILHAFGVERYGVWVIAISLGSLFTLADFGVVNSMLSYFSKAFGQSDGNAMQRLFNSTLLMSFIAAVALTVSLFAATQMIDWGRFFGVANETLAREASWVVFLTGAGIAIQFPLAAVRHARLGMLQGVPVNMWDLAGSLLATISLVIAALNGADIITCAALWTILPAVPKAISAILFLLFDERAPAPARIDVNWDTSKMLLIAGGVFTLSGLCQALAVQSDQILIANVLGISEVAPYSVVQRLFSQPQIFVALLVAAQWPSYGEALGRGDGDWITKHFIQSLGVVTAFAFLCAAFLAIFCSEILELWVGKVVRAEPTLVLGMAIYCVVACVSNAIIAFFLALGLHRRVIILQIAMFAVNLPVSLVLLPLIGSAGAIYGTALGYLIAILIPGLVSLRSTFDAFPRLQKNDRIANGQ